jgi:hypothetical protein
LNHSRNLFRGFQSSKIVEYQNMNLGKFLEFATKAGYGLDKLFTDPGYSINTSLVQYFTATYCIHHGRGALEPFYSGVFKGSFECNVGMFTHNSLIAEYVPCQH